MQLESAAVSLAGPLQWFVAVFSSMLERLCDYSGFVEAAQHQCSPSKLVELCVPAVQGLRAFV